MNTIDIINNNVEAEIDIIKTLRNFLSDSVIFYIHFDAKTSKGFIVKQTEEYIEIKGNLKHLLYTLDELGYTVSEVAVDYTNISMLMVHKIIGIKANKLVSDNNFSEILYSYMKRKKEIKGGKDGKQ